MRKLLSLAAMVLGATTLAMSTARADSVTAHLDSMPLNATVGLQVTSSEGTYSAYVYTGQFHWTQSSQTTGPLAGSFGSFCIDIKDDVDFGHDYAYTLTTLDSAPRKNGPQSGVNADLAGGMGSDKADMVRRLFGADYGLVTTNETAAAFQLALWNIVYDTDQTVSTGSFRITPGSLSISSAERLANSWLAGVAAGNGPVASVLALSSDQYQDQVVMAGIPAVPSVPATVPTPIAASAGLALLGLLGGHQVLRRRHQA